MNKLLIFLKHFLIVVLPLLLSGASVYADSSGFRHYTNAHPALAVYVPVVAGLLKATHALLPPSPYSVRIVRRVTSDIDAASSAIIAPAATVTAPATPPLAIAKEQDASLTPPSPAPSTPVPPVPPVLFTSSDPNGTPPAP